MRIVLVVVAGVACVGMSFAQTPTDSYAKIKQEVAVVVNADNGAEVFIPTSGHISHAWESAPGKPSAYPWTTYKPGGDHIVADHDNQGRLFVAWISGGKVMVMTEPYPRSSLDDPVAVIFTPHIKDIRLAKRPDGRLILVALSTDGQILVRRQQEANSWDFVGNDVLASKGWKTISVAPFDGQRFAIVAVGKDHQVHLAEESSAMGPWNAWIPLYGNQDVSAEAMTEQNGRLQILALDKKHKLYSNKENVAGQFPAWTYITSSFAGSTIMPGRTADGTLLAWDKDGNAFTETGPNGAWHSGGQGMPNSWALGLKNELINANPVKHTYTTYSTTYHPAVPNSFDCNPDGMNDLGYPCVAGGPGYYTTTAHSTTSYEVHIIRNGVDTLLISGKP